MAKQTINIGSGELTGDGESLRSAFDKINDNFNELYLKDTSDFDGQFSSLTGTPTTLAGYGITDAYTQAQVDAAIATVTAGHFDGDYNSLTNLPTLFDGQYSSLTGTPTIPADVSDLTDTTNLLVHFDGDYNSLTNQPTIPADVSDLTDTTNLLVHFDGELNSLTNSPLTFTPEDIGGGTPSELSINAQVVDFGTGNTIDLQNNTVNFTGATITGTSFLTSYTETDPVVGAITGIVKADGAGNISAAVAGTDYLTSVAFADLTSTPTTLSGYGITDALTAGGALTGSSLQPTDETSISTQGTTLELSGGDSTGLNSDGGDLTLVGGNGSSGTHGDISIGATQTGSITIGSGSNSVDFPSGTTVDFTGATVTGLPAAYTDSDVDTHLNTGSAGSNEVLSWDGADYAWVAQSGGGSGLQSRSTATGTTSSLADAAEADLDITGFKSYALLAITTDRAARVRLYVTSATRTADASRAEGVDPTSDAGLIAEVITTGAQTVIISPGAFGFNLEGTPTTNIPCRVTNKSGGTSTVQVDLNILQLEA